MLAELTPLLQYKPLKLTRSIYWVGGPLKHHMLKIWRMFVRARSSRCFAPHNPLPPWLQKPEVLASLSANSNIINMGDHNSVSSHESFVSVSNHESFIGSIDQGTTSTRFLIFNKDGEPVASHQVEFSQIYPESGLVHLSTLITRSWLWKGGTNMILLKSSTR